MGPYDKCDKIGTGSYGIVYGAMSPGGNSSVAIKCNLKNSNCSFFSSISELDINHKLGIHPYILALDTITQGNNPFKNGPMSPVSSNSGVMDKIHFVFPRGVSDLRSYIKLKLSSLELTDLKSMMVEILLGVEYIHGRGYIHRDIKPDNVIVTRDDKTGQVTMNIADFGLSKMFISNVTNTPGVMTSYYRPPEILLYNEEVSYDKVADMWSVGCMFYELITGVPLTGKVRDDNKVLIGRVIRNLPYDVNPDRAREMDKNGLLQDVELKGHKLTPTEFLRMSQDGANKFESIGGIDAFWRVLMGMLSFDPNTRWSASRVLDDPFFDDHRSKIQSTRDMFPPVPKTWPAYKVMSSMIERSWMLSMAMGVYKTRSTYRWYSDKILFHSISMMDRVITHLADKEDKPTTVTDYRGTILTKHMTELYYISCLYLCIKYFSSIHATIPFESLASEDYITPGNILKVENFEKVLIGTILKYEIYRPTPYDELMSLSGRNDLEVLSLLILVINAHHKNKTASQTVQMWLSNRDYYMEAARSNS